MNHIRIDKPCSENWAGMTPTEKGAFCQKCAKQVIDFTQQSIPEIRSILYSKKDKEVCARIEANQLDMLNQDFNSWRRSNRWSIQRATFYAFLFVFGLSMVSCSSRYEENQIARIHAAAMYYLTGIDIREFTDTEIIMGEIELVEGRDSIPDGAALFDQQAILLESDIEKIDSLNCTLNEVTMGAIVPSADYIDHLNEIVPEEDIQDQRSTANVPTDFRAIAFPNPTNGRTTIKIDVPSKSKISFALFTASGTHIRSLGTAEYESGTYEIPFDLSRQAPGTYLITIYSSEFNESVRVSKM